MPRSTFCGTLEYMAPEMLQNQPHDHTLDVWSLGILLYELYHGYAPFTGKNPFEILAKITKRQSIRFGPQCTPEYKDLVERLLQNDPAKRIPLIQVFDHPWVRRYQPLYEVEEEIAEVYSPKSIGRSPSNSIVDEVLNQDTTVMLDIEDYMKGKKK